MREWCLSVNKPKREVLVTTRNFSDGARLTIRQITARMASPQKSATAHLLPFNDKKPDPRVDAAIEDYIASGKMPEPRIMERIIVDNSGEAIPPTIEEAQALLDRGAELAESGGTVALEAAIDLFQRAAVLYDTRFPAYRNIGHALSKLERNDEAAAAYRSAHSLLSRQPEERKVRKEVQKEMAIAHVQHARKNENESIVVAEHLDAAFRLMPDDQALRREAAFAMYAAGAAHGETGDVSEALATTRRSIHLMTQAIGNVCGDNEPECDRQDSNMALAQVHAAAYVNLGVLLLRSSRAAKERSNLQSSTSAAATPPQPPAEAMQAFDAAIELDPLQADGHYHKGNQLRAMHSFDEALKAYEKGVLTVPTHPGLRSSLGYALLGDQRTTAAKRELGALVSDDKTATAAGASTSTVTARQERGAMLLRSGEALGVWQGGAPWQHPAELTPKLLPENARLVALGKRMEPAYRAIATQAMTTMTPKEDNRGFTNRGEWARVQGRGQSWSCLLSPLESSAQAIALEAKAALPSFRVQHEAIAVPPHGWREFDVLSRCNKRKNATDAGGSEGGEEGITIERTCAALDEVRQNLGPIELRGAAFSALLPGTRLLPHCGTTNRRLTLHLGLSIPKKERGTPMLRLGRPRHAPMPKASDSDASDYPLEFPWVAGGAFVWDDSYAHEVYWKGGAANAPPAMDGEAFAKGDPRVILLLTINHPSLVKSLIGLAPPCP